QKSADSAVRIGGVLVNERAVRPEAPHVSIAQPIGAGHLREARAHARLDLRADVPADRVLGKVDAAIRAEIDVRERPLAEIAPFDPPVPAHRDDEEALRVEGPQAPLWIEL